MEVVGCVTDWVFFTALQLANVIIIVTVEHCVFRWFIWLRCTTFDEFAAPSKVMIIWGDGYKTKSKTSKLYRKEVLKFINEEMIKVYYNKRAFLCKVLMFSPCVLRFPPPDTNQVKPRFPCKHDLKGSNLVRLRNFKWKVRWSSDIRLNKS